MRDRIVVSAFIGLISGSFCWYLLHHLHLGAFDFNWTYDAARDLLAREDPYSHTSPGVIPYPLIAALVGLPFAWLPREVAGGAFFGFSSALLAFGLTREGYWRLFLFLCYPFWAALIMVQWTPLITASALFSICLPFAMAKPQIGLPVVLTHLTRLGVLSCLLVAAISFIIMPNWMMRWLPQLRGYEHFFPLFIFPGPLLLLALLRCRHRDGQLLLFASLMPQRWFYDGLILWLIPRSRRELLGTAAFSWGAGIWRWYRSPASFQQVGRAAVVFIYLPMLVVVLARQWHKRAADATAA